MDLRTTLVLEVRLCYLTNEAEEAERARQAIIRAMHETGISCQHYPPVPVSSDGSEQMILMYLSIPDAQRIIETFKPVGDMQTRLHAAFLIASRRSTMPVH